MSVGGVGIDEVPRDAVAAAPVLGAPEQLQPGSVRPEDAPVGIHPAEGDRRVLEELDELLVRLGWPLEAGKAVAHQFRRAARLATEHLRHERPRIVVVFHDQHPDAREVGGVVQTELSVRLRVDAPVGRLGRDEGTGELTVNLEPWPAPGLSAWMLPRMRSVASVPTMSPLRPPSGAS